MPTCYKYDTLAPTITPSNGCLTWSDVQIECSTWYCIYSHAALFLWNITNTLTLQSVPANYFDRHYLRPSFPRSIFFERKTVTMEANVAASQCPRQDVVCSPIISRGDVWRRLEIHKWRILIISTRYPTKGPVRVKLAEFYAIGLTKHIFHQKQFYNCLVC